jgi:phosphate-selective porin OprO/OprP
MSLEIVIILMNQNQWSTHLGAFAVGLTAVVGACTAAPLEAQDTASKDNAQVATKSGLSVKWNNGISVETDDGENKLQFGALLQMDGRFVPDDPLHAVTDTLVLRRARPILQGRAARYFEFRLMPDFGNGTVVLFDAYFDTRLSKSLRVRVGKDKTPIGLEQLYSDYAVLFPERSLVTNLVPNRDVGVQVQGDIKGMVSYVGALFNGVPDANNGDIDTNDGKDLVGRVVARPFSRTKSQWLRGAGVAVAGSWGRQAGPLPAFKSAAQQTFFSYAPAAVASGERTRISPSAFWYYRSFGAFTEYARSTQGVRTATVSSTDVSHRAWGITGSFVLTGEAASERGVSPKRPFSPADGRWGALQVIARYGRLEIDPVAFSAGFAAPGASSAATAVGAGVSWYLTDYVKYVLTYERTTFDDDGAERRQTERAIVFRLQLNLQPSL